MWSSHHSMLAVSRKLSASRVRSIWGWAQHCWMIKTISNLSRLAASWANHCQLDEHNDGNRTYWVEMWAELCTARLSRQVTDYVQYRWSEQSEGISSNSVLLGWAERWQIISNITEVSRAKAYPWTLLCSVEQRGDRLWSEQSEGTSWLDWAEHQPNKIGGCWVNKIVLWAQDKLRVPNG